MPGQPELRIPIPLPADFVLKPVAAEGAGNSGAGFIFDALRRRTAAPAQGTNRPSTVKSVFGWVLAIPSGPPS
jgi:hypothetical protein